MPQVFAFTGTPGTGVQASLMRFRDYLAENGLTAEYICLDNYLWYEFVKDVESSKNQSLLKALGFNEAEVTKESPPNWLKLLNLPSDKIRDYWERAAIRAVEEIKLNRHNIDYFLISFHAFYYSDNYRWRFCAISFRHLLEFNFKAFFVLIDDIYNILERRQMDIDHIYDEARMINLKEKHLRIEKTVLTTVDFLKQYIYWRQAEIAQTDLLAHQCNIQATGRSEKFVVPSHIFSVKHPMATLKKLIENPSFSIYFSHPITNIRRSDDFPNNIEFKEIYDICQDIRNELTLIEPTTIDEARIKKGEIALTTEEELTEKQSDERYLPALNPRWKFLEEEGNLLLPPPEQSWTQEIISKLKITEDFYKYANNFNFVEDKEKIIQDRISQSLYELSKLIYDDITWRDYHLVDQTRRLIVYRPCLNGNSSRGVRSEVKYYERICAIGGASDNIQVVLYHPSEDDLSLRQEISKQIIERFCIDEDDIGQSLDQETLKEQEVELIKRISEVLNSIDSAESLANKIVNIFDEVVNFHHTRSITTEPLRSGSKTQARTQIDAIKTQASSLIRILLQDRYYTKFLEQNSGEGMTFVTEHRRLKLFDAIRRLIKLKQRRFL